MDERVARTDQSLRRVLIVEDEAVNRSLYREILREAGGFRPILTESAEAAQEHLREVGFGVDVCLVDLVLPGMKGEDLIRWIKSHAPTVPIVVVSGQKEDQTVVRALRHGASDFITKPVDSERLLAALEEAIDRQARFQETPEELEADQVYGDWVEITSPSEMEYLGRLQRFTEVLLLSKFPPQVSEDLRITIEELGRNAIEWGNKFDRSKKFRISYCTFPDRIILKFEDEGEGFRPEHLRNPTADPVSHIKQRQAEGKRPGGFGVFLVQKLMDEVQYSERGNVVLMTKYLPAD
jgi:DNA-binding response OmpR family regulator